LAGYLYLWETTTIRQTIGTSPPRSIRSRTVGRALELAYSPKNAQDLPGSLEELRQPVVYHLFGKLSSQPDYVITDEDMLEFLHHTQSKSTAAEHLFDALRNGHLLFVGCAFPDRLSRFLLRIAKSRQLSLRRNEMELLVGSLANRDSDLVVFLRHFSPRTKIASCSPAEFVGELAARYTSRVAGSAAPLADLSDQHDAGRRQSFRQLAGGRLLLYQSTSMSRKCDSPLASSYTLWIRIAAHSCICPHFPDSGRERLILRINRALGNKIGSRSRYQRIY